MAASYSSFLTSQFYSPIFNTALFDGAFRIYFSQSYESTALKIYHLLQTEQTELWNQYKKWSEKTKNNVFILIYPSKEDVSLSFACIEKTPVFKQWDEGISIGFENTFDNDIEDKKFKELFKQTVIHLNNFIKSDYTQINEANS